MHTLLATIMIAALLWAGVPSVTTETANTRTGDNTTQTVVQTQTPEERAREVALDHADLAADQVERLYHETDFEDGVWVVEVEFRCGDWEYDYTIHRNTLQILKHSKEYDPPKQKPAQAKPQETTKPVETKPVETKKITADEAKAIALAHAGLSAKEVKGLRAEYDWDDGRPEYEVNFRVDRWEYEYTIHAETGKILDWEKDWDD